MPHHHHLGEVSPREAAALLAALEAYILFRRHRLWPGEVSLTERGSRRIEFVAKTAGSPELSPEETRVLIARLGLPQKAAGLAA